MLNQERTKHQKRDIKDKIEKETMDRSAVQNIEKE